MRGNLREDMPKRIQRKRTKGWRMPAGAVYVGRPTRWGNPYTKSEMGVVTFLVGGKRFQPIAGPAEITPEDREVMTEAFRRWLHEPEQDRLRRDATSKLRGKDLACWCPLNQPCHADVLLELVNEGSAPCEAT